MRWSRYSVEWYRRSFIETCQPVRTHLKKSLRWLPLAARVSLIPILARNLSAAKKERWLRCRRRKFHCSRPEGGNWGLGIHSLCIASIRIVLIERVLSINHDGLVSLHVAERFVWVEQRSTGRRRRSHVSRGRGTPQQAYSC